RLASDALRESAIGVDHRAPERRRQRRVEDRGARRLSAPGEVGHGLDVEAGEDRLQARAKAPLLEERAVEVGRRREAVDGADSLRAERVEELAQRGVLAADA